MQGTDPLIGTTFADRYRIERRLGAGGMGAVYVATQLSMDRQVALKVLGDHVAHSEAATKRFYREMQATARVEHQNTIRVYDFGESDDGQLFLAMELLDGKTLHAVLHDEGALDTARSLHIAGQIARALGAAHHEGIVHRDLKPENVMLLDRYGERDFVKVLDFGIARFATGADPSDGEPQITKAGTLIGTPLYMSPEQALGRELDGRSDLYALGVLLFQMTTGSVPFTDPTPVRVLFMHAHESPPRPSEVAPGRVPPRVEHLINRLLDKDPNNRPQTASEVVREVRESTEADTLHEGNTGASRSSRLSDPTSMARARARYADPQAGIATRQSSVEVDPSADATAATADGLAPVRAIKEPSALEITAPTIEASSEQVAAAGAPATAVNSKPVTVNVSDDHVDTGALTMVGDAAPVSEEILAPTIAAHVDDLGSPVPQATPEQARPEAGDGDKPEQASKDAAEPAPRPAVQQPKPSTGTDSTPAATKKSGSKGPMIAAAAVVLAAIGGVVAMSGGGASTDPNTATIAKTTESEKTAAKAKGKEKEAEISRVAELRATLNKLARDANEPVTAEACQSHNEAEVAVMIAARKKLVGGRARGKRKADLDAVGELEALEGRGAEADAILAKALLFAGRSDTEIGAAAKRATKACAQLALAHATLGTVHLLAKRADAADAAYSEALKHAPDYRAAQFNYGLAAVQLRDSPKAIARFDKLIAEAPNHPRAYFGRAQAKLAGKDFQGALKDIDVALQKDPNDGDAHFVRGISLIGIGAVDTANEAFCKSSSLGNKLAAKQCKKP